MTNILPLFMPHQLRHDIPARRTFYGHGSSIDHFYDIFAKQKVSIPQLYSESGELKTCKSIDGNIPSMESLEEFHCNENHLMIVLRGEDAVLHGGNAILRGGCWVVLTLLEYDKRNMTALWSSVVRFGGSRVFFMPTNQNSCRTCSPVYENGSDKLNMLEDIVQKPFWNTIVTYGIHQIRDAQVDWVLPRKWLHNFVKIHALRKMRVFVTKLKKEENYYKRIPEYGNDLGRQHKNMLNVWAGETGGYSNPFFLDYDAIMLNNCVYSGDCFQTDVPYEVRESTGRSYYTPKFFPFEDDLSEKLAEFSTI